MLKINTTLYLLILLTFCISCGDDDGLIDPVPINEEEEISQVVLTFTPDNGGDPITATWLDADGEGSDPPIIDTILLRDTVTYTLDIVLTNTLGDIDEDITAEILEEADEHMFFFAFTDDLFFDPPGDGNADTRLDPINYNDQDANGLPIGLSTTWGAGGRATIGEFRIVLKHQPDDQKTDRSNIAIGGTDVDITFQLTVLLN